MGRLKERWKAGKVAYGNGKGIVGGKLIYGKMEAWNIGGIEICNFKIKYI
jgi:hypothetical protein